MIRSNALPLPAFATKWLLCMLLLAGSGIGRAATACGTGCETRSASALHGSTAMSQVTVSGLADTEGSGHRGAAACRNAEPTIYGLVAAAYENITTERLFTTSTHETATSSGKYETSTAIFVTSTEKYATSIAPDATSIALDATSMAPDGTSIAPDGTSMVKNGTSMAPNGTSRAPNETSRAPNGTSMVPNGTSMAPNETSMAPDATKTHILIADYQYTKHFGAKNGAKIHLRLCPELKTVHETDRAACKLSRTKITAFWCRKENILLCCRHALHPETLKKHGIAHENHSGYSVYLSWPASKAHSPPEGGGVGILDWGFWIAECGVGIADWGLRIADFGLRILDWGFWIGDCGVGILDCGVRIGDWGLGSGA